MVCLTGNQSSRFVGEWPAGCRPWHPGYAQESIKINGVLLPIWRCSTCSEEHREQEEDREKEKCHMIPSLRNEHTTVEKTFGSKILTILKMGVLKSSSNSKVKKKQKQNPNNPREGTVTLA